MDNAENLYDVVIVGGGASGLTAALYLSRARYRPVVVEKERFGGQITITNEVVNYPGIARASGAAISDTMRRQAQAFGAEFLLAEAEGLDMKGDVKIVRAGGKTLSCFGVLLATGAH
ncbi:MAG: NAD(P)/FAD-dependent oxidoreductase, partial [Planctomycetota bacterium]|nr:NAD(P)/FAD-dependent oxidoreductase [Planctomycetota bacterium]